MRFWILSQRKRILDAERRLQDWLNPEPKRVTEVQLKCLNFLWTDTIRNVPYYRRLVEQGRAPPMINSIQQFRSEVPILTKDIIRLNPELFRRLDRQPDRRQMTAGSTGEPLHFGVWKSEDYKNMVDGMVGRLANGMDLRKDKIFLIWGHSHLLGTGLKGRLNNLKRHLKDNLLDYKRVDAYNLSQARAARYFQQMIKYKPNVLIGYSAAVDLFVRHNEDMHDKALGIGLKMVICTSEMMPRLDSKETIERFFDAPVVMEYGSVECGTIAYQLQGQEYRTFWWNRLLEVKDTERTDDGALPLLVTRLDIHYLPLFRYCIGDAVINTTKLPDGQVIGFKDIAGRMHDMVDLGYGEIIHSVGLFHCIHQEKDVFNIQLILEPSELKILLVAKKNEAVEARIRRRLKDLNPHLKSCTISFVEDLQTTMAGKRRWIIDRRPEGS